MKPKGAVWLRFEYRARDEQGSLKTGIREAEHKSTVIEGLLAQNYYIVSLQELSSGKWNGQIELHWANLRKVSGQDLAIFTRQLSVMLAAGLPVMRCLTTLGEQAANSRLKEAVVSIQADIEAGLPLWEAFGRYPKIFSGMYISMLKIGETGGILDSVLDKLSYYLDKEQEFQARFKSASIYPLFISAFALLVVVLVITLIMPRFVSIFQASGVQLPLPTRMLLGLSTFLKTKCIFIISAVPILLYLLKCCQKTERGRLACDNMLVHLPVLGRYIRQIAAARFARTMGVLIKSGINVLPALEVVKDMEVNTVIKSAIAVACSSIREGQSIASPLQRSGVFEPLVAHMIAVGEETGRLDETLIHLSDYYEGELIRTMDSLIKLTEPLLILLVALVVGGVVIAILFPMFDMINLVGV